MQVTIHGESKYIPVSTVTIQREGEGITHPFHCVSCGNTTNIIGGQVIRISPVLEPSYQIPVVTTCKSCKAKYVFQDSENEENDTIKIVLHPGSIRQIFYCYLGGGDMKDVNRIIEYERGNIFSYVEGKNVELPFLSPCTNPQCNVTYHFSQFN